MRKFALVLVLVLALPAAASARFGDKGDGTLVVKGAKGQLSVNAKSGSTLGRVDDGTIVITDMSPGSTDDIQVVGDDQPRKVDPASGATIYTGTKMRFRIIGGGYLLVVTGKGINVTAVGKGAVWGSDLRDGQYAADGGVFRSLIGGVLPLALTFGQQ